MNSIKMALLCGAALAVTAAGARADDLEAMKAQIEALNARVAAMEAAPAVPAGYQLVAFSEGDLAQTPGLDMSGQTRNLYGNKSNVISVLPTADAPAGTTVTWSGFVRAGLVYQSVDNSQTLYSRANDSDSSWSSEDRDAESDDIDVYATANLRVKASTDTAVGEVGVDIQMEMGYDGVESEENYKNLEFNVAWGYWAMTPELTFGGGYAGSLGNVSYGFDGGCQQCHYYSTISFNPGDTTQLRLSYASGPFSAAIALEDASYGQNDSGDGILDIETTDTLGVAGEIKYSGDMFSGEISGVWRDLDGSYNGDGYIGSIPYDVASELTGDSYWQVGAGVAFGLGEVASVSLAAAMGHGPTSVAYDNSGFPGPDFSTNPWANSWWGVSGIVTGHLSDEIYAEVGAGYKAREYDDINALSADWSADSSQWAVGGGLYYNPVDQLTIGVEASWLSEEGTVEANGSDALDPDYRLDLESTTGTVAFVSVWRF